LENELKVSMRIDAGASQQRVIDVLSLLAQIGVARVTVADTEGEEGDK